MLASDYDDRIRDEFLGKNQNLQLRKELGTKRNYKELRLSGCGFAFDIFVVYKYGELHYCNYYHAGSIAP